MFCSAPTTETRLAPPQANQDDARGSVCQPTNQWADEVEAYARELQARLDEMMATQGATIVR